MARNFNGTGLAHLNFGQGDVDAVNLVSQLYCVWVKISTLSHFHAVLTIYGTDLLLGVTPVQDLRIRTDGGLHYRAAHVTLPFNNPVVERVTVPGLITIGNWHHIAWTVNGVSQLAADQHMYVDGVEPAYVFAADANGLNVPEIGPWIWGGRLDGLDPFQGDMAEAFYRGAAWSLEEINSMARGASPEFFIRNPNQAQHIIKNPTWFYAPLLGTKDFEQSWVNQPTYDLTVFAGHPRAPIPSGVIVSKHPPIFYPSIPFEGGAALVPALEAVVCIDDLTDKDIRAFDYAIADRTIRNIVVWDYDWDGTRFTTRTTFRDEQSIVKYGEREIVYMQTKGVRTEDFGLALITLRAREILLRWSEPPPIFDGNIHYRKHRWDVADLICITSNFVPNLDTGLRGIIERIHEIVTLKVNFAENGGVEVTMYDIHPRPRSVVRRTPRVVTIDLT